MKATIQSLGAMLLLSLAVGQAAAQYISPLYRRPFAHAPDACGPGFYLQSNRGMLYYPSHYVYPPFQPVNGIRPGIYSKNHVNLQHPLTGLPLPVPEQRFQMPHDRGMHKQKFHAHPFVRGPRDFFMWSENMEDQFIKQRIPSLIP